MAFIDTEEVARIFAKYYNPDNNISRVMWRNPQECLRFHFGFVEDNQDPDKKGRIKVRFPHLEKDMKSDWCPIIRPFSGTEIGMFFLPEIDEPVLCTFLGDNPEKPLVIGSLRNKDNPSPVKDNPDNNIKKIVSRSGITILMNDKDGEERLEISMLKGKMKLVLDKSKGIEIINEEGEIKIKCDKKFTMEIGDNASIKFDKEMSLKSEQDEIKITSSKDLQLKSGGDVEITGSTKIKLKGITTANSKAIAKKDDMVVGVDIHQVKIQAGTTTVDVPLPHPYIGKLSSDLSDDVENDNKAVAKKGSKSKHNNPGHIAQGISWSGKSPSGEGEVSSNTESTVKVNDKEIAVIGSMVKTCNFPKDNETCSIIAIGAAVKIPIIMVGVEDQEQNKKDGGMVVNANNLVSTKPKNDKTPKFTNVKWSKTDAKVGEEITLEASLSDQYENAGVDFKIFKDGADVDKDMPVAKLKGQNKDGKAKVTWRYIYVHDPENPLKKKPKFFYQAWSFKCEKKKSDSAEFSQDVEIKVLSSLGLKMKDLEYILIEPDGNEKNGKSSSEGKIKERNLIPGEYKFKFKEKKKE